MEQRAEQEISLKLFAFLWRLSIGKYLELLTPYFKMTKSDLICKDAPNWHLYESHCSSKQSLDPSNMFHHQRLLASEMPSYIWMMVAMPMLWLCRNLKLRQRVMSAPDSGYSNDYIGGTCWLLWWYFKDNNSWFVISLLSQKIIWSQWTWVHVVI